MKKNIVGIIISYLLLCGFVKYDTGIVIKDDKSMDMSVTYAEYNFNNLENNVNENEQIEENINADNVVDETINENEQIEENINSDNLLDETPTENNQTEENENTPDNNKSTPTININSSEWQTMILRDYTISEYGKDNYIGFTAIKHFDNINKISSKDKNINKTDFSNFFEETFIDNNFFIIEKGLFKNKYIAHIIYTGESEDIGDESETNNIESLETDIVEPTESENIANDYLTFEITLPTKALSNNAKSVDGLTYKWDLDLYNTTSINFEFEIENYAAKYILIGVGVLIFVIIILGVISSAKKEKKENEENKPVAIIEPPKTVVQVETRQVNNVPTVAQSEMVPPMEQPEMVPPMEQSEMVPPMEQPEMVPPMEQSEIVPPMEQPEMVPPMEQSEMVPPIEQSEMVPPIEQSEMVPPMEQSEMVPPMEQPEMVPPMEQPEMVPPIEQSEMVPPMEQSEMVPPMEQSEMVPPMSETNNQN